MSEAKVSTALSVCRIVANRGRVKHLIIARRDAVGRKNQLIKLRFDHRRIGQREPVLTDRHVVQIIVVEIDFDLIPGLSHGATGLAGDWLRHHRHDLGTQFQVKEHRVAIGTT